MAEYMKPTWLQRFRVVLLYVDKELIYELGHCLELSGDSRENESYSSCMFFFSENENILIRIIIFNLFSPIGYYVAVFW